MAPIRVLVVDDSAVVRKVVTEAIESDPALSVVGTARNGVEALAKIADLNPDIMTLDIEMPEMDGIETLRRLRDPRSDLPIVMLSNLTVRGSTATLDALALGARDYVAKPSNTGSVAETLVRLHQELLPKLKALGIRKDPARQAKPAPTNSRSIGSFGDRKNPVNALVIASSTGGPIALESVLSKLSHPLAVPAFIVQHIPPVFSDLLAQRLDDRSPCTVTEASEGDMAKPGTVYLAPGGKHMRLEKTARGIEVRLSEDDPIQHCRPAADALFASAVDIDGGDLLGVVLTGMGQDGLNGSRRICAAGGSVLAQDEASSVVWGMPGAVAESELANEIIPLDQVAHRIEVWLTRYSPLVGVNSR